MVRLHDTHTNALVGEISDDELAFLIDQLEEESTRDRDYYFDRNTVDVLVSAGAPPHLISVLERAIAASGGAEVRWEKD